MHLIGRLPSKSLNMIVLAFQFRKFTVNPNLRLTRASIRVHYSVLVPAGQFVPEWTSSEL